MKICSGIKGKNILKLKLYLLKYFWWIFIYILKKIRLHIYDVKSSGSFVNGNSDGVLEFKIRENNDDKSLENNFKEIKQSLKDNMGLEVASKENSKSNNKKK